MAAEKAKVQKVLAVTDFFTGIIEDYPDDYPFPSCLVLGATVNGKVLHVVVGVGDGCLWLITAYYSDPLKWNDDFSIRKERQE